MHCVEAGFTDSAHFNRCFRDTFGINPSLVFNNIDRFYETHLLKNLTAKETRLTNSIHI